MDYLDNNRLIAHYCGFNIMEPLPSRMTETLIPLYQLGSLPRLAFALFFAGCSAICSCLPSPLFHLGHVLLISIFVLFQHTTDTAGIPAPE
ncbi:hypothetical protein [Dysosmobacter sp.]|uniref:hypothetical protein n=1 Tax=Dysosmobacter sp. TaxID=2591382 RepID=UPI002A7ECD68|nr:hypothetical protein [Dysosmobacter sp.]MCI6936335.1 hypothetical protein [Clostridiales bacterium]MCI7019341.1 hypothetical protein [Clostridiales bacterium]